MKRVYDRRLGCAIAHLAYELIPQMECVLEVHYVRFSRFQERPEMFRVEVLVRDRAV